VSRAKPPRAFLVDPETKQTIPLQMMLGATTAPIGNGRGRIHWEKPHQICTGTTPTPADKGKQMAKAPRPSLHMSGRPPALAVNLTSSPVKSSDLTGGGGGGGGPIETINHKWDVLRNSNSQEWKLHQDCL